MIRPKSQLTPQGPCIRDWTRDWTSRDVWKCGEKPRITSATAARVRKDQIRRQKRVEGGGTVQKIAQAVCRQSLAGDAGRGSRAVVGLIGTPRGAAISCGQGRPDRSSAGESRSGWTLSSGASGEEPWSLLARTRRRPGICRVWWFVFFCRGAGSGIYWSRAGRPECSMTEGGWRLICSGGLR